MLARRWIAGALGLAIGLAGSASRSQTLLQVLASTYETNPALAAERDQLEVTDEKLPQALANWKPTLSITAGTGEIRNKVTGGNFFQNQLVVSPVPPTEAVVTLNQPIYRGGRTVAETREA